MMNEITRIHIAKVAYDIEVTAKKQLEKYIKSLEAYTRDAEVLSDIEIRITELLLERGVKPNGVIASDDVTSIREQLGEPYEFADEDGDIAVGAVVEQDGQKFYRSVDDAVLGGVLSGIALYFKVNPLWTRLIFILLTVISFGTALLVYILLWIVVPPARTATEKLRQTGRPVTLDSIRELNQSEEPGSANQIAPAVKRAFSVTLGVFSLLSAVGVVILILFGVFGVFVVDANQLGNQFGLGGTDSSVTATAWVVYSIIILGLLLLAALLSLIAYAFFAQKLTKRMIISGVIVVVLGLTSFAATLGIVATQAWRVSSEAQSLVKESKVTLPKEFATVRSIVIDKTSGPDEDNSYMGYPAIEYVVDEGAPRYELSALPNVKPVITVEGENAKISLTIPNDYRNSFVQTRLVIYGPALNVVTNSAAVNVSYTAISQATLEVFAENGSNLNVNGGSIETIRELTVSQPDVCPSGSGAQSGVRVSDVTSKKMTYNGVERDAKTHRTSCAEVIVGDNYDYDYSY